MQKLYGDIKELNTGFYFIFGSYILYFIWFSFHILQKYLSITPIKDE